MKKSVAIIGGGPAAMMLGCKLNSAKYDITIYEKNKAIGRKFLVAGNGGFNLTHGEGIQEMAKKYTDYDDLQKALFYFTNEDTRVWLKQMGIETFVGSSNRVFPTKKYKPIKVLNAIIKQLEQNKVAIKTNHEWIGFTKHNDLEFETPEEEFKLIKADIKIFALGGGSWSVTGANSNWLPYFNETGISTKPFEASNCGFTTNWKKAFATEFAGEPLKNIAITYQNTTIKGEVVITQTGLEGGAIYALSKLLRDDLKNGLEPVVYLNLKPTTKPEAIIRKLKEPKKRNSWSEHIIWKLKLSKCMFQLIKRNLDKEAFLRPEGIGSIIQQIPIKITGIGTVEEAISTVGGIPLSQLDANFKLKNLDNTYALGEMLDWDAPTGGYLLQGCFSMGAYLANELNKK